jgi:hypothetical protein
MNLIDKRAIKIVELQEKLEEANKIIQNFVWPSDYTKEEHQRFLKQAAKFIGGPVPIFSSLEGK